MATGKFVFTFTERELSIIEQALETCSHYDECGAFGSDDYREMGDTIGARLAY